MIPGFQVPVEMHGKLMVGESFNSKDGEKFSPECLYCTFPRVLSDKPLVELWMTKEEAVP